MIKGVIFDFDGTLVSQHIDFDKIKRRILQTASTLSLRLPPAALPILELLEKVRVLNPGHPRLRHFLEDAHRCIEVEEGRASALACPFPGVKELLDRLKAAGVKIGIITRNSRKIVERIVAAEGLAHDCLIAREDVGKVKPHPEHLSAALRVLGLKPAEVLMVGDHRFDVQAAHRLKIKAVAVLTGGRRRGDFVRLKPYLILESVAELAPYFDLDSLPAGKLDARMLEGLLAEYAAADRSVEVGPEVGRDAAVLKFRGSRLIAKTDPISLAGEGLGGYLVQVNANDIAVMAGVPKWLLTTFIFPVGVFYSQVEEVFRDVSTACKALGIGWAGGHTEVSDAVNRPLAAGMMLGVPAGRKSSVGVGFIRPGSSMKGRVRPGDDLILVREAGIEGASILCGTGSRKLRGILSEREIMAAARAACLPGLSIVKEALLACRTAPVHLMHDPTEGGVATGIHEMAQVSGVGIRVEEKKIAFHPAAKKLCAALALDKLGLIASGCLLLAAAPSDTSRLLAAFKRRGVRAAVIGRAVPEEEGIKLVGKDGTKPLPLFAKDEVIRGLELLR